jgi:prepilin-type N-terminal cleavage/methylation domain-containing protein
MKTQSPAARAPAGFTLVEMIGVLAVIAILASVMIPRVFAAIMDARVSSAAATCKTIKIAVSEYYGRYTRLGTLKGGALSLIQAGDIYDDWDTRCLVPEGILEKPFLVGIGNQTQGGTNGSRLRIVNILGNVGTTEPADDGTIDAGAYDLDGAAARNDVLGLYVVEACIEQVDNRDAFELSVKLDGLEGSAELGQPDSAGRVKYNLRADGTATVRVYIAHK